MRALIRLAAASAWNRRRTLGLMVLAVLLATTLLLGVERLRLAARDGFAQSVSGTDLVVGARGSPLQLMLHAVFRLGEAGGDMRWESYRRLAADPAVAWAIPLALGDSYRGFPVVGTDAGYFTHYRYGERQTLAFAAGGPFGDLYEAVLGAEVAAALGHRTGDALTLSHGSGGLPGTEHADKPFRVVGVLAPTGTPVDRSVHVSLAAIEAIHLDWQGGAPIPGLAIPPEFAARFDLTPKRISAALIGLHQRTEVFRVQRAINESADEPLTAVLPGVALDQLWQVTAVVERALAAVSWLVLATGLAGLAAVLLASVNERRRELAVLRSVGAGARHIVALLVCESLGVTLLGSLLAVGGLAAAGLPLAPWLAAHAGIAAWPTLPSPDELRLLAAVNLLGAGAGLLPAYAACRAALGDGLIPRL